MTSLFLSCGRKTDCVELVERMGFEAQGFGCQKKKLTKPDDLRTP